MSWTDDRVEKLKALHKDGFSASQIAKALGGVTRNAVIGKAHRLGLGPIGGGRASAPANAKAQHGTFARQTRQFSKIAMTPAVAPVIPATPGKVQPLPKRIDVPGQFACELLELTECRCKWPLGAPLAPANLFCGEPLDEDRDRNLPPYCDDHLRRAFQPGQKKSASDLARSLRRYAA